MKKNPTNINNLTYDDISKLLATIGKELNAEVVSFMLEKGECDLLLKKNGKVKVVKFGQDDLQRSVLKDIVLEIQGHLAEN